MNRLKKFEAWRISPSLLEFPEHGPKFPGGYATVSRAILHHSDESDEGDYESDNSMDEVEQSNGHSVISSDSGSDWEDERDSREEERSREEIASNYEGTDEELEQGSEDDASEGWMVSNDLLFFSSAVVETPFHSVTSKAVAVKKMRISGDTMRVLGVRIIPDVGGN